MNKSNRIDRKGFLGGVAKTLGALGLTGLAFQTCRKKEGSANINLSKKYSWKMVTTWPKNFPGLGSGAEKLVKNIKAMSAGRIDIKLYAAGELVPAFEVFHTVSKGVAEMGHSAAYYWKGSVPEAQFFAAVPFGLNATEMSAWLRYGGGQELWDDLYANFNLKPFPCGNTGAQMGGWFNRPIKDFKSFKGLKIRMPGLGGEVLRRAGATVVSLPGGEIFQALQSGAIDAAEWVGPYNDLAFGFHKAAKHYYWPGWHEPGTALELMINKEKYEELPEDLKEIIKQASRAAYEDMLSEFQARNNEALDILVNKRKVKLSRFSDDILKETGNLSKGVVSELSRTSSAAKRIHASYLSFRKKALKWNYIGEESFSAARMLSD